jgi:hypothetical protein
MASFLPDTSVSPIARHPVASVELLDARAARFERRELGLARRVNGVSEQVREDDQPHLRFTFRNQRSIGLASFRHVQILYGEILSPDFCM